MLKELGFTDGEEKVYKALLSLGASTTGPIAKESGVSRSKLYEILEKLSKKGLVSHFKVNKVSTFKAAPPERITEYLENKEKEIAKQKESLKKQLPMLKTLIPKSKFSEAEVYEGMEGIKNVREDALTKMKRGETMYFFGNSASGHEHVLGYWDDWNNRRIKKQIKAKIIYNQDAKKYAERRKKQKYTEIRYLSQKGNTHAWIEIYNDTIAIVMKHETPMSIVITNKFVAESFRTYFNILWNA